MDYPTLDLNIRARRGGYLGFSWAIIFNNFEIVKLIFNREYEGREAHLVEAISYAIR